MIPFGQFRPDVAGINTPACRMALNCLPAAGGFKPLPALAASSGVLTASNACLGGAVVFEGDGTVHSFAGTSTDLCKLQADSTWADVSRLVGGAYSTGSGERWKFGTFGSIVIATTISEPMQKYTLGSSTNFENLGGSPPRARYIDVVRDFVLVGGIENNETRVQWSAINNAEGWTPGTNSSDYQDFASGGPVRGLVGGEVAYVFQAAKVTRMTFVPGSAEIFQFDEVEGGRGLAAPHSLVKLGGEAFYMAQDGFYKFSLSGGASAQIGEGKWAQWFLDDIRPGTEQLVIGGVDPARKVIVWAYVPRSSAGSTPSRVIFYNWVLDEATIADVTVLAMSQWLTQGVTLDDLGAFGTLDELPFSLDSPVWRGGVGLLGVFSTDAKLSYFAGSNMEAQFETSDGQQEGRVYIKGVRPSVDTRSVTVAVAGREADGDPVTYGPFEAMEDTGICPAHVSGNIMRAKAKVAAGASWALAKGIIDVAGRQGKR